MKRIRIIQLTMASLAFATMAHAGGGDNGGYGLFFWIFVSVGTLVVATQLLPAILMVAGFIKGVPAKRKMAEAEVKQDTTRRG